MIKWIKPNSQEITTNDMPETIAHCESLGWQRADAPTKADNSADITANDPVAPKKRGRPKKKA